MKKIFVGILAGILILIFVTQVYFYGTGKMFSLEVYIERISQITTPPSFQNFEIIWKTELHPDSDNKIGEAIMNAPVINDIWQVCMKVKASVMLVGAYITWVYYTQNLFNPIYAIVDKEPVGVWGELPPEQPPHGGEWI